jgi:hypothetical protein
MWRVVLPFAAVLGTGIAIWSCQDLPNGIPCSDIPPGGCPIDRGGSCDDPTCSEIYLCENGVWVASQTCGPHDGGTGTGGDAGTPNPCVPDSGTCTPTMINTKGETTGCTPDLMFPDCPAAAAQGCAECVCTTGCADFYLCLQPDAGMPPEWVSVAGCTCEGDFVSNQP